MRRNNKVWPKHRKIKQSVDTVPEEVQMLELIDYKSTTWNISKELKETMSKEPNESIRMVF